jgi:uncharacterized protein (DUF2249 family)
MEHDKGKKTPITPETRVGELLDAYPELEEVLLEMSPSFAKLRNPVLRKTVAKVTTLSQAARVGSVPIERMINGLRTAAGIEESLELIDSDRQQPSGEPPWFAATRITHRLDVRPVLERGEKPVGLVMSALKALQPGEIYELTAPFLPAPLIDMAKEKGYESWSVTEASDLMKVYFCLVAGSQDGEPEKLVDLV